MNHKLTHAVSALGLGISVLARASAAHAQTPTTETAPVTPSIAPHGPSSGAFPSHHFQWAPHAAHDYQVGVNFGLLQLALGGFNIAGELRYRRLWLEYSHGVDLHLNDFGRSSMTQTERDQNLRMLVPYTTGFGIGATLVDELWLGVEFKAHRFEVNAPGGPTSSYETYSVGPVLGYKFFIWRGLHLNAYGRYWPNVATSLHDNKLDLRGTNGTVSHDAHDWGLFANVSLGYTFDL